MANNAVVTQNFALHSVPSRTVSGTVTDGSGHHWPLYAKITVRRRTRVRPIYTNPFTGKYSVFAGQWADTYQATVERCTPAMRRRRCAVPVAGTDVTKNVALTVLPSCTAPGYVTKYSGLVQHFDTATKPAGWTVTDNNDSGGVWVFNDPDSRGNQTGGSGQLRDHRQ